MKDRNVSLVFIIICILIVTGCSNILGNEEQRIEVQKDIGDNEYEDFKVVTDNNEVMQVKKILKDTIFENKKWKCLVQLIIILFFNLKIRK